MLQMHGAQSCVCCGSEVCYYIATLCPCETNPPGIDPEVRVPCAWVQNIVASLSQNFFVFQIILDFPLSAPCYRVGLDSAQCFYPPQGGVDVECPPPVTLPTTPEAQWLRLSCEECCEGAPPPLFCWAIPRICDIDGSGRCSGGAPTLVYVPLGFQVNGECPEIPDHIWSYNRECLYIGPDSDTVTTLPPGAVEIPSVDQFESCPDCCGNNSPPCEDCSGCPPTKTYTVGSGDITGGGTSPCQCDPNPTAWFHYDQTTIVLSRVGNTCHYEGTGSAHYTFFAEDENGNPVVIETGDTEVSAGISCVVGAGNVARWRGGDNLWGFTAFSSAINSPCPPNGAYNQDITPQPWPPNCCNYPTFFTIG